MFGHTFLKLNSRKKSSSQSQSDLLNYGVNFSADAEPSGLGITYVLNGLLGGYEGYYSITHFYTKLNKYINKESRDLWEYELALSPEALEHLTARLWELRSKNLHFTYFFVHRNCSYYILDLLF